MSKVVLNRGVEDTSPKDTGVPGGGNLAAVHRMTKQSSRSPEDTGIPRGGNPAPVQRITKGPMNFVSPLTLAV